MVFELFDLRIKDNRCQVCVHIESKVTGEIRIVWQDLIKNFLMSRMVKVDGDWQKAINLFPNEEFPEDEENIYILKSEVG